MARRRLAPADRRQAILEAAVAAFDEAGADDVGIEAVAERAGVSRALVYTYFTNRQGLVRAVFDHVVEDLGAELDRAVGSATTPEQRVGRWVAALAGYARSHPQRWRVVRRTVLVDDDEVGHGLGELLDHLGPGPAGAGGGSPLALTALVGMVDWTAEHLDEQGAHELARLAWAGASGLPGAAALWVAPTPGPVDNLGNPQGCSPGVAQGARPTVDPATSEEA